MTQQALTAEDAEDAEEKQYREFQRTTHIVAVTNIY
jgi:hypothetical protein